MPRVQSAPYRFEAAEALVEGFGLISATPDVATAYAEIKTRGAGAEGLGDLVWSLCRSHAPPIGDAACSVRLIGADRAAARLGVSGKGIRIGQPDTGVALHDALAAGVDRAAGFDVLANRPDPTDPLLPGMSAPGRGTGTGSVVIARPGAGVAGAAPGATLVPVRCIEGLVIGSGTAVARAIDHARAAGCRVITMSLGGPFAGLELRRAIARAVRDDLIVLAAAGNCVGVVVYPAWDRNVIAVAGVDAQGRRWKWSCAGPEVDVAAPAENVHVARRDAVPAGHVPTPAERGPSGRGSPRTHRAPPLPWR